ncbi:MAG: sulfate adenylyltransferase [Candidatus Omnitrophica bacterium]|nr:sulfate adenylyltransferase [Candidatus Omnitrophota bacterium]
MDKQQKQIKILCTLGPSSLNEKVICRLDERGVDLFRLNLSHIPLEKVESTINEIRKYSKVPICLDTEGAQVRTGSMKDGGVTVKEGSLIILHEENILGDEENLSLVPHIVMSQLRMGDLISIDYDTALLRVASKSNGFLQLRVLYDGSIASNKGVSIIGRKIHLPALTQKDIQALEIGREMNIKNVALSFANRKEDVAEIRRLCDKETFLMSKIETHQGLLNLTDIIRASDAVLIDRGDLSKEESIVNIPFLQKMIIENANKLKKDVYVATNLLESMITSKSPTRAEVNDVINTLVDGADGLVLAAETAVGQHPVGSVTFIHSLIKQYMRYRDKGVSFNTYHDNTSYLIVPPHGEMLIDRIRIDSDEKTDQMIDHRLIVDESILMDVEQIAIGGYSPITGFMNELEMKTVLDDYCLPSGVIWTLPIILQAGKEQIKGFKKGQKIGLVNGQDNQVYGILHLEELFKLNFDEVAQKWYQTKSHEHPGVKRLYHQGEFCLAGKVDLVKKIDRPFSEYILSPIETRAIFEHKGWTKVVGFHTRNVIHRGHEFIQMEALAREFADGLFVHPLIGPKKKDDFASDIIINSYQIMIDSIYPKGKVLFSVFSSYPRYAGPREAVFTALCRKNYGCSHFIVGRDHSGVGNFYGPNDSRQLFESLQGLGVEPVFFDKVFYDKKDKKHIESLTEHDDLLSISGTLVRETFKKGEKPAEWLMRDEISSMIEGKMKKKEKVFI